MFTLSRSMILLAALSAVWTVAAAAPKEAAPAKGTEAAKADAAKAAADKKAAAAKAAADRKAAAAAKAAAPKPPKPVKVAPPWVVPALPDGKPFATDTSQDFLKPVGPLADGVTIAKTPPTVDFLFLPEQNERGKLWSNWGDGCVANGKYYSAIGDHNYPTGTAHVYEYDPETHTARSLVDLKSLLNRPEGHYSPSKIHSRVDMGSDGWLYYSTHRGSENVTNDANHYIGDWILRTDPKTGKSEIVAEAPVEKHCIPTSVLDPDRLIFYGGTAQGKDSPYQSIQFLVYDVKNKKVLYRGDNGPPRYIMFAKSTGRVYYVPSNNEGQVLRYDPAVGGSPTPIDAQLGLRAATQETPQGIIYTASTGQTKAGSANLYAFNVQTEQVENLGPLEVANERYVTSMDADPTGRYVYYIPGAHGSANKDGTPVIQFDTKTKKKKVICFLEPFYTEHYNATLKGTYSTAVSEQGDILYVTWNIARNDVWDCGGLTAIHIPESERKP